VKNGRPSHGEQQYRCNNPKYKRTVVLLQYHEKERLPEVKRRLVAWRLMGAASRYRLRAGGEPNDGDYHTQKKAPELHQVNPTLATVGGGSEPEVVIHNEVGKRATQPLARKHLPFRTRIRRVVRNTICFSRSVQMQELVSGLLINRFEVGLAV
jgi:hypothetical protein